MKKLKQVFTLACHLLLFLSLADMAAAQPGTITTVVGTGTAGFSGDGGLATAAKINSPRDVYIDGDGNIYIADFFNHCVRKVDATSGIITTVAGTGGVAGFSGNGGPATAARLNNPCAIVKDAAGNLYIADQSNQRIRKVDASGIITTFAGTGTAGFSGNDGPATSAKLNFPNHLEVDGAGNVYICDQVNDCIRKVDASGTITMFAGTGIAGFAGDGGPATSARLNQPSDVLRDAVGNFYIVDRLNRRVRKIDTDGIITTIAGTGDPGTTGDGGPATSALLNEPVRVILDGVGNLYISDRTANRIRMVNGSGIITAVAGTGVVGFSGDSGPAISAQFDACNSVGIDGSNNLYIVDQNNDRIRKVFADPPIADAGADQTICTGESAILGATPAATRGTTPYSFNWTASPPDPSLTAPTDENPMVSPTVTTTYTLTVTDFNSFTGMNEITVTVNPLPTATVSGDASICAGSPTTLTATLTGTGPWNITWSDAVTQNGITNSPATRVVNPASTTTYSVTAVSDANCTGTSSGSAMVTVNPNSVVANAGADLATAASVLAKIGANPTASGGTSPLTYLWSPAAGLSSITAANPTATPSTTTTYTLTVTDENNCTASDQVTVRAGNLVNSRIKLIIGPTNVYDPPPLNRVRVDMGIKNISGAPIYGPLTAVFKTLTPGPPTITIPNTDGGGNGLGSYYDYSTLLGPDNVLSPGETTSFKLWIFQEHVIPAVNFKFFVNVVGDLDLISKVAADDQPLALSFDLQKATVQSDSESESPSSSVEIPKTYALHQNHPNPFNPSTTMQFDLPEAGEVTLKIYNSVGQLVRTLVSGNYEAGAHKAVWDARNDGGELVTSGVYLAVFKAGEVQQVRRVLLMK